MSKAKVLIVEDEVEVLDKLKDFLVKHVDCEVATAINGGGAVKQIKD